MFGLLAPTVPDAIPVNMSSPTARLPKSKRRRAKNFRMTTFLECRVS